MVFVFVIWVIYYYLWVYGCYLIGIDSLVNNNYRLTNQSWNYLGVTLWSHIIWHDSMVMILWGATVYSLDMFLIWLHYMVKHIMIYFIFSCWASSSQLLYVQEKVNKIYDGPEVESSGGRCTHGVKLDLRSTLL